MTVGKPLSARQRIRPKLRCGAANSRRSGGGVAAIPGPHHVYPSLKKAAEDIAARCRNAVDLKILANKGLVFIGTDDSLVSTAEIYLYRNLRKLRVLLMSEDSRWIAGQVTNEGTAVKRLITLRKHESLETYLKEIRIHTASWRADQQFAQVLAGSRSGVRYFTGEPCWRMVMTESTAFVSNYADEIVSQCAISPCAVSTTYRDLSIARSSAGSMKSGTINGFPLRS